MPNLPTDSSSQRQRILSYLKENGSGTTYEFRDKLDIPSPAPRIFELRHNFGKNIVSHETSGETEAGGKHRVARYVLKPGNYRGDQS